MPLHGLCREIRTKDLGSSPTVASGAHVYVITRHSPDIGSELFQECEQFIIGSKAFRNSFHGIGLRQGLFFQCEVGIEIDLSGFHRLMTQPKGNHGAIHAGLEQFHSGGVPEDMWGYALLSQGNAVLPRLRYVPREQVLNPIGTQRSTARTGEQGFGLLSALFPYPRSENCDRGFG